MYKCFSHIIIGCGSCGSVACLPNETKDLLVLNDVCNIKNCLEFCKTFFFYNNKLSLKYVMCLYEWASNNTFSVQAILKNCKQDPQIHWSKPLSTHEQNNVTLKLQKYQCICRTHFSFLFIYKGL